MNRIERSKDKTDKADKVANVLLILLSVLGAAVVIAMIFAVKAHPQTLQHHSNEVSCEEHVSLTRHWLKDASRASTVGWQRRWLTREYKVSFDLQHVAQVCQNPKTQAQYDLDLADVRLQLSYDLRRKEELKAGNP